MSIKFDSVKWLLLSSTEIGSTQGRPFGSTAAPTHALEQPMAVQHGVNARGGGSLDGMRHAPQETVPDLACPPVRLLPLGAHDGCLQWLG